MLDVNDLLSNTETLEYNDTIVQGSQSINTAPTQDISSRESNMQTSTFPAQTEQEKIEIKDIEDTLHLVIIEDNMVIGEGNTNPNDLENAGRPSMGDTDQQDNQDKPYSEADVIMLSKMVWGEARGCSADEQRLCVWTVLNRLDDGRFGESIAYIVTAPHQFIGYKAEYPVTDEIYAVANAVLEQWAKGDEALICPPYAKVSDYLYFSGDEGHNWFR